MDSVETSDREENCVQGGWCTFCVCRLTSEKGMPVCDWKAAERRMPRSAALYSSICTIDNILRG